MRLRFRKYSWQLAPQAIKDIRATVFIDEQRVPPDLEWDDTDEIADHFLALDDNNTPVAVARLYPSVTDTIRIGRMAVLKPYRGRGHGEQLLRHLIAEASSDFDEICLSAQVAAIPFYQRAGFHACSAPYDDAGIEHVDMRCLGPRLLVNQWDCGRSYPLLLGEDTQAWMFQHEDSLRMLIDSVVGQAQQRVLIYDRHLDHDLYGQFRLRERISALARRHRLSEVRILIHDDKPLVKKRHLLVELMRRLPSKIELRLVHSDYPAEEHPFMLVYREGLVYRHRFDKPEGLANFADRGHVKRFNDVFQRMWDTARPSPELRDLPL